MKDRAIFKYPFVKSHPYQWQCPTCKKGVLEISEDSFFSKESSKSRAGHDHPMWEPEYIELVFSCLLECSNNQCNEVVACTGVGSMDFDIGVDNNGNQIQEYNEYFKPTYFQPNLNFFDVPIKCPEDVKNSINKSFSLILVNPDSASNHIRVAVELLLNNLKIKRFSQKNGKRSTIKLHQRIESLKTKYLHLKDLLLAIKWLGNAGSHASKPLSIDDVFNAYDILDVILTDLYANKAAQVKSLAKNINKNKGPK
jgi:hypothetical protein